MWTWCGDVCGRGVVLYVDVVWLCVWTWCGDVCKDDMMMFVDVDIIC